MSPHWSRYTPKRWQHTGGLCWSRGKEQEGRNSREKPQRNPLLSIPSQKGLSVTRSNTSQVLSEKLSPGKGEEKSVFPKHIIVFIIIPYYSNQQLFILKDSQLIFPSQVCFSHSTTGKRSPHSFVAQRFLDSVPNEERHQETDWVGAHLLAAANSPQHQRRHSATSLERNRATKCSFELCSIRDWSQFTFRYRRTKQNLTSHCLSALE